MDPEPTHEDVHQIRFAYLSVRRQHFVITAYDAENQWTDFPVKTEEDLVNVKAIMKAAMETRSK